MSGSSACPPAGLCPHGSGRVTDAPWKRCVRARLSWVPGGTFPAPEGPQGVPARRSRQPGPRSAHSNLTFPNRKARWRWLKGPAEGSWAPQVLDGHLLLPFPSSPLLLSVCPPGRHTWKEQGQEVRGVLRAESAGRTRCLAPPPQPRSAPRAGWWPGPWGSWLSPILSIRQSARFVPALPWAWERTSGRARPSELRLWVGRQAGNAQM